MKRLRVLISTHEFSPYQGSECAVGWNIVTRLASYHDVTALCAAGSPNHPNAYKDAYFKYVEENGSIPGLKVVFVEQPPTALRYAHINRKLMIVTKGFGWQPLFHMGLDGWHREAFSVAQNLELKNFDVIHQVTPTSFIRSGYLWKTNLPFFWGPLGGMYKVPLVFALYQGIGSLLFEIARSINIRLRVRSHTFRSVVRKAKQIWTISIDDLQIINRIDRNKGVPLIEAGPPESVIGFLRRYDGNRPLVIMWSGQHEPHKALPLLLHALSKFSDKHKLFLNILGEGSETKKWKALANQLALNNIKWHGRLPYFDALQAMRNSDIFIHTSVREGTSLVLLEAMGWGLPVICHDTCGMAFAVDDTCGIKVPFVNPKQSIDGFYVSINKLLKNPALVTKLSEGALRRSSELSWDAKAKAIAEAYCLTD